MTFVRVNLEIDGVSMYNRAFSAYGREVDDMREPLGQVADVILESVREQFATEGAHGLGEKWHPLEPGYEAWKEQHYPGRSILVRTGELVTQAIDKRRTTTIEPRRLVYEIDSDYAGYHQRGTEHMPARPIVALTYSDRRDVDRIFHEWLIAIRRGMIGARL
jgi:phage gpG-like protein